MHRRHFAPIVRTDSLAEAFEVLLEVELWERSAILAAAAELDQGDVDQGRED